MTVLYRYFVSFRTPRGFGNGNYDMRAPITKRKQLDAIEADLRRTLGEPWATVISFQFLGRVQVPTTPPPGGKHR